MCFHKQADFFPSHKAFLVVFPDYYSAISKDITLKPSECERRKFACSNFLGFQIRYLLEAKAF